ncbi:addiction module protein [Acidithiobacillus ferrooxidans]|uniref:addiction module protein n=1 Tax=Acidithiobacillus ferrooxidans TaxID=920 RepID=UPI000A732825|nr:addiction module protein [Acidithiobacillus ferrooxidans]MCR2830058.1 addiction module protein [Acidithiobacillus ferrooxidans]
MTALPKLGELTVSEKLRMMESFVWHGEILVQRENTLRQGTDHFSAWDTAKANVRKSAFSHDVLSFGVG